MIDPKGSAVDITNCDREPIHIPGAIQPHGVLLVLQEPGLIVTQASENASDVFGRAMADVLGQPLPALLGHDAAANVRRAAESEQPADSNPLRLIVSGSSGDGVLHRHDNALILEIEPREAASDNQRSHHLLRGAVANLQSATTLTELYDAVTHEVHRLTAYERVMIYRFDEEGHGSVEAEVKPRSFEPYLGQHYPASDIPRQARELYLRNAVRIIPDARYTPAAVLPAVRPDTGAPLDMSFCILRSVSPIHLEYLANMGVRASMSISLVVRDRLWGLISCVNHSGPRYVAYELRSDCEVLGRIASQLIAGFADREIASARDHRRPTLTRLSEAMRDADDVLAALLGQPAELLELLEINGAAVVSNDVGAVGLVPSFDAIRRVADWLEHANDAGVFATDSLSKHVPELNAVADVASGVVSFALPGTPKRRFLGFRPEILRTVNWGGDPRKPVEDDRSRRLHPRRSFALWREEVRGRSKPWGALDLEAAEELRRLVVEVDLEKQVSRAQRAVRARDDIVAVVSHDLRDPLNVIQMQAASLRNVASLDAAEASHLRTSAERIGRSVAHMDKLLRDLLDVGKIESGRYMLESRPEPVDELLREALVILRPLAEAKGVMLREEVEPGLRVFVDRERVFRVLSNVVGNAIKFTPSGGRVLLRAEADEGYALFDVTDTGPGLAPEQFAKVFERYWRAPRSEKSGTGLGLYIAKGIVEAHGGRMWAEPGIEGGASFRFTLPLSDLVPAQS